MLQYSSREVLGVYTFLAYLLKLMCVLLHLQKRYGLALHYVGDQLAALIWRNFGVGEQNPLFKGILPAAVVILASLLTRLRRH